MKNIIIILCLLISTAAIGQSPILFNYQGMALDQDDNAMINQNISLRLTVKDGPSPNGRALVQEIHDVQTNSKGLFNLLMGNGQRILGDWNNIDWSQDSPWLSVDVDFGGGLLIPIGESRLVSVPYAMHAATADDVDDADADPTNEIQQLSIIGQNLMLSNGGGTVTLPTGGGPSSQIMDTDGDTHIQVEQTDDEDVIRFTLSGLERMTLIHNEHSTPRLEIGGFFNNTFVGQNAGEKSNPSLFGGGGGNTAFGKEAGQNLTVANENTMIGFRSGRSTTTGGRNTAIGAISLSSNTEGGLNTALGYGAAEANTKGGSNTALGYRALTSNTEGNSNVAIGRNALFNNTTQSELVAVGALACQDCEGYRNTAVGYGAMRDSKGVQNTASGYESMALMASGDNNTAMGTYAMGEATSGSDNTAMGSLAMTVNQGNGNTGIGTAALQNNGQNNFNTAVGYESMKSQNDGIHNVAVGANALSEGNRNDFNVAVGFGAMAASENSSETVAIGLTALRENGQGATEPDHGQRNTAVGSQSMNNNTIGYGNTALGYHTLQSNVSGTDNVAIGEDALNSGEDGWANTAVGANTLVNNTSSTNTAVGAYALRVNEEGFRNTALGHWTLTRNVSGDYNVGLGSEALFNNTTGSFNTAVGYAANNIEDGLENTTALGYGSQCTASNQVRVGNSSVTSIGGYVEWTKVSDGRFKSNVKEDVPGLEFIQKLRPVTYNLDNDKIQAWKNNHGQTSDLPESKEFEKLVHTGFIAQEVEAAAMDLNYNFSGVDRPEGEADHYGIRYSEFVMPLVKAVQELTEIIEKQDRRIEELEAKVK